MGIKGLTSYADSIGSLWTQVNLNSDTYTRVIVDGSALLWHLYGSSDCQCGGQYGELANAIKHFFRCFSSKGIKTFVILDGPTVAIDKKLETLIKRAKETIQKCRELSQGWSSSLTLLPPLAKMVFVQELQCLKIDFAVCDG